MNCGRRKCDVWLVKCERTLLRRRCAAQCNTIYAICLRYVNFNHARKSLLIYFVINNRECQNIQSRLTQLRRSPSVCHTAYGKYFYRIVYVEKLLVLECTFESNVWQQRQLAKLATTTKMSIAKRLPMWIRIMPCPLHFLPIHSLNIYINFQNENELLAFQARCRGVLFRFWICK